LRRPAVHQREKRVSAPLDFFRGRAGPVGRQSPGCGGRVFPVGSQSSGASGWRPRRPGEPRISAAILVQAPDHAAEEARSSVQAALAGRHAPLAGRRTSGSGIGCGRAGAGRTGRRSGASRACCKPPSPRRAECTSQLAARPVQMSTPFTKRQRRGHSHPPRGGCHATVSSPRARSA